MTNDVDGRRLARAIAIVAMLFLSVPVVGALADSGGAPPGYGGFESARPHISESRRARIDADALIGTGDAFGFLSRLEAASSTGGASAPKAFEREAGLPRNHRDLRVSEDGAVASCMVDAPADFAADDVRKRMVAKGWSEVPLGAVEGATYVKADGQYTWMLVTCTQVGDATNVVFRCVAR